MFAKSVLVTGSNRGIGLEFIKQLVGQTEYLFAACRSRSKELDDLAEKHKNIFIVDLDVTSQASIDAAYEKSFEVLQENGLNCLINNAGVVNYEHDKLENITSESLVKTFTINTVGPAMITKAFLPLLRKASSNHTLDNMCVSRASIVNISSKTASIDDNSSGKLYGSRLSKTALNMLTKNLSIELLHDKIIAVALNPGWVKTDNGGENALTTTQESVEKMLSVLLKIDRQSTGKFLSYNDQEIPW